MSIAIEPTPEHEALARAVNARMAADSRIVNAKAMLLRLAGVGALVALTGVGAAAAMFGYSLIKDERPSAERLADAMARALDRTTLKTAGEVRVAEGGRVRLEAEALKLDPAPLRTEGTVKLDPEASVKLDPAVLARLAAPPRPTPEQLRPQQQTPAGGRAVTNYTVFKTVPFGRGNVVTGWSFASSEETAPSRQYCYFTEGGGADSSVEVTTHIALNGAVLPNVKARTFDVLAATASCVWFDGRATRGA